MLTPRPKLEDLVSLRSMLRRPGGVDSQLLNTGEHSGAEHVAREFEDRRREVPSAPQRLIHTNFHSETGKAHVDKHMMAYIEGEMRRRGEGHAKAESQEVSQRVPHPDDDLYQLAERYQVLVKEAAERESHRGVQRDKHRSVDEGGNPILSAAMLSSVPEVDLGVDARLQNIEATEKAKRELYEKRRAPEVSDDDTYTPVRFAGAHTSHANPTHGSSRRREYATDERVVQRFRKRQRPMG